MSLQLTARGVSLNDVERRLDLLDGRGEVFLTDPEHVGISIPTRLLDAVGEDKIRKALKEMIVYDLYAGVWGGQ
jgi:hypothetical protein